MLRRLNALRCISRRGHWGTIAEDFLMQPLIDP